MGAKLLTAMAALHSDVKGRTKRKADLASTFRMLILNLLK